MRRMCRTDLVFLANVLGFYDLVDIHRRMADFICSQNIRKVLCGFRTSFKSVMGTICRPIQKVIQPDGTSRRILITLNNQNNATAKLRVIRQMFESNQLFRALFPEILPKNTRAVKWSDEKLDIAGKDPAADAATFTAMGVGGQAVSGHYTDLVLDDIVAPGIDDYTGEEILPNREEVEKAVGWFRTCDSLLINQKEQEITVLCNRWFPGDHYDAVAELNKRLPERYRYDLFNLSIMENGVPTFPERYGLEEIEALKASKGAFLWASQYLCSPTSAERQVFNPKWFKTFTDRPEPMKVYMTLDRAGGWTRKADYTVLFVGGIAKNAQGRPEIYALHYDRGHFNTNDTAKKIIALWRDYKPIRIGIEKDILGQQMNEILKDLKAEANITLPITMLQCRKQSKASRIQALQPYFEDGRAYFRKDMGALETELLEFSLDDSHRHDDILDCWAYFLKMASPPVEQRVSQEAFENPFKWSEIIKELGCEKVEKTWNPTFHTPVSMRVG